MLAQYQAIRQAFTLERQTHKSRHRDIASKLGISEGELIAAHVGEAAVTDSAGILNAIQLQAVWPQIIESLEPIGPLMALTRNASCVHERTGVYHNASHSNHVGLVVGKDIDLRVFYHQWHYGFAVAEKTDEGLQRSLQFFDAAGVAIHKIFVRRESHIAAYEALVEQFTAASQCAGIVVKNKECREPERDDSLVDVAGFRQAWAALQDTHDFFALLKRFAVSRTQGLRLADSAFAQPVELSSAYALLCAAAQRGVSIMVFVSNAGMLQIHTGVVHHITRSGPWVNVLDEGFNLHLRADHIASAWVVKKPTVDGIVTSLELFDKQGETIAMLFGERKPGRPELASWRTLIDDLLQESTSCAAL